MLGGGGSTGISLLLTLGLMMGILLIIVVVVILLTRKRKKQREENLKVFTREIEDRKQENGVCDSTFYELKNGCCELRSNADELSEQARKEMALNITTMLMLTVLPEMSSKSRFQNVFKNHGEKYS